ncbi:MAG: phosphatidylglycerol lysyltransferase domain-containing protein [Methylovulum sp.]|nr:phosphatidylglycerol lysyltransferase domain-containing protein [Methylovulum sp.]
MHLFCAAGEVRAGAFIILRRTDVAVIRDGAGQIKAFANLWQTANHQELSVDLMRYDPDSPKGIMDFLFAGLMLWGKAENYRWFALGMASLAHCR